MPTMTITSHHHLERDLLTDAELADGAPHRIRCHSCSTPAMNISDARAHVLQPPIRPTATLHTLFTIA